MVARPGSVQAHALFADLVARQSRFAFRIAYAIVRNAEDAEDVVQDTFLKLLRTNAWTIAISRKPHKYEVVNEQVSTGSDPESAAAETR